VTGYAVAMPGHVNRQGRPVWFGGGRLAADLTLPKLRQRWRTVGPKYAPHPYPPVRLTVEDRNAIWNGAARTAAVAAQTIRTCAFINPAAAADAAWAASDTLCLAASVLGSHTLRRAADGYDHAARHAYGRIPRPTPTGDKLRATARLLAITGDHGGATVTAFLANLASLAAAVADLRDAQHQAAQAAAARAAAEQLRAAIRTPPICDRAVRTQRPARRRGRAITAADLARLDYPGGFQPPTTRSTQHQVPAYEPGRRTSTSRRAHGPSP